VTRALLPFVIALAACEPSLDQRLAIVREPRVLAITAEPPEAKPGAAVALTALIASPDGPIADAPQWSLCTAPKPPTEDNAVSTACLDDAALIDLGATATATATIPGGACIQFGPDVPAGGFRPRDPDATGGYYQPVRADVPGADLAFGFARISCKLANAPADVAHDYLVSYVANQNPTVLPLGLDAAPDAIGPGAIVTLTASWPDTAVESYLYYDPSRQQLVTRREAMRVSWFATAGELAVDASVANEESTATTATTTWRAPTTLGPAWLWIVLRDSRGGTATQIIPIEVR
jgi:hypothetical protein